MALHSMRTVYALGEIRETQEYGGLRVLLEAKMANARIPLQIDIGFGDVITPEAEVVVYPSLLDLPSPRVRAYPRETVVAEKLQAMVVLGMLNSRMKDFYDLYAMAGRFSFESSTLAAAIDATFERRRTQVPTETPVALGTEFATDKQGQWKAFLGRTGIEGVPSELAQAVELIRTFLVVPLHSATSGNELNRLWQEGGPWRSNP